ncbi:hypothetical protein [Cellulomonas sp. SLBN-39]|uniref:hypothetical protein n=1 Tax=Cellulomonas sp. SLBN-39 TaxID=2768446 RepID=UPI001152BA89|nr:hypothetical protein [Cellulomonas sp. SLBN-39]TQL02794.1 hypothetical protein FBY24_1879 [Cellulomonas sp. SLBN-39]
MHLQRSTTARTRATAALTLTLVLLTGCAAQKSTMPGVTGAPTTTPTSTPTATATADGIQETSDPDLGIVFEDVPDLTGTEADVYDAAATFQKEYWRMMTTLEVSPAFSVIAAPDIAARMQEIADNNAAQSAVIAGTFHTTISDVTVSDETATARVCDDYREVTVADADGTYTAEEAGLESLAVDVTLGKAAHGGWTVLANESAGAC